MFIIILYIISVEGTREKKNLKEIKCLPPAGKSYGYVSLSHFIHIHTQLFFYSLKFFYSKHILFSWNNKQQEKKNKH